MHEETTASIPHPSNDGRGLHGGPGLKDYGSFLLATTVISYILLMGMGSYQGMYLRLFKLPEAQVEYADSKIT